MRRGESSPRSVSACSLPVPRVTWCNRPVHRHGHEPQSVCRDRPGPADRGTHHARSDRRLPGPARRGRNGSLTAFPLRAEALADEVAKARPHVLGLQEVSQIDVDLNPVGVPLVIHQDFIAILQAALAARGLNYVVAASIENINAVPVRLVADLLLPPGGAELSALP